MNPYVFLGLAIVCEIFGTSMMKISGGFKKLMPSLGVILGMGLSFYFLSHSLKSIPLGTAYAIWSGGGTALTALVGILVYKEGVDIKKILGLALIIIGVVALKLSSGGAH